MTCTATSRPGQAATRYDWLSGKQRSSETLTGLTLIGVRLNPTTGHFLSTDPIPGGNANAYEYCNGDPVNGFGLEGRWSWAGRARHAGRWAWRHKWATASTVAVPELGAAGRAYRGYSAHG
ncbi:RHS repeat-associated core domain-containing protein [Streptomyces sp. NPDC014776]|uniref:RHS repeat-associated core domain-containing protein n=1 Tax=unclassified Streptomyces TaxID=2593676 RepID=UPI0036FD98E5